MQKWVMKIIFLHADKRQSFLQVVSDGFDQAYPKCPDKFAISLWYLKKEVMDEVEFLLADAHESFP